MAGKGRRSWYNMLRMGSTIAAEAWDNVYKSNLAWQPAWGAAAANVIARRLMGIRPLKPGFEEIAICPQSGGLPHARIVQPSPRGSIGVEWRMRRDGKLNLRVTVPANTTASASERAEGVRQLHTDASAGGRRDGRMDPKKKILGHSCTYSHRNSLNL